MTPSPLYYFALQIHAQSKRILWILAKRPRGSKLFNSSYCRNAVDVAKTLVSATEVQALMFQRLILNVMHNAPIMEDNLSVETELL